MFVTHRFRLLVSAFALVWLGTACPAEEDPPEGGSAGDSASDSGSTGSDPGATSMDPGPSTGDPGSESSTSGVESACSCAAEDEIGFIELSCEFDELCEPVVVDCALQPLSACGLTDLTVLNPEVLECHRAALAAGEAQMLRWELPYVDDPGVEGQRRWVDLTGDGQVLTWHESWAAPTYAFSDVAVGPLRPAEHFDGCMKLPTPEETLLCLYDAIESVSEVCIPAHDFPIG